MLPLSIQVCEGVVSVLCGGVVVSVLLVCEGVVDAL